MARNTLLKSRALQLNSESKSASTPWSKSKKLSARGEKKTPRVLKQTLEPIVAPSTAPETDRDTSDRKEGQRIGQSQALRLLEQFRSQYETHSKLLHASLQDESRLIDKVQFAGYLVLFFNVVVHRNKIQRVFKRYLISLAIVLIM